MLGTGFHTKGKDERDLRPFRFVDILFGMKTYYTACIISVVASFALADVVLFKTGDRLSGKIGEVKNGTLHFTSTVAGPLVLKMVDIQSFSSDEAITVVTTNGAVVQTVASLSSTGTVSVVQSDGTKDTLAFDQIAQINPAKPKWTGSIVASFVDMRGNTELRTVAITADAHKRTEDSRAALGAGYYYGEQRALDTREKSTTDDNFFLEGKYDYFLTKKVYAYGTARYFKDRMLFLERRITAGLGLGYQWAESDAWDVFTEAGLTSVTEKYTDPEEASEFLAARGAYHILYKFSDKVEGFHNLEILPSLETASEFLVNADAGVRAKLASQWFAEAKVQMLYDSQAPADTEKMDTRYTVGLGWKF